MSRIHGFHPRSARPVSNRIGTAFALNGWNPPSLAERVNAARAGAHQDGACVGARRSRSTLA
jgi:hypothetical protein